MEQNGCGYSLVCSSNGKVLFLGGGSMLFLDFVNQSCLKGI